MAKDEYEVERILSSRVVNGMKQYRLKWKGYPLSESTWVDEENLQCEDLLEKFERAEEKKARKKELNKRKRSNQRNKPFSKAYRQSDSDLDDEDYWNPKRKVACSNDDSSYEPISKKRAKKRSIFTTPVSQKSDDDNDSPIDEPKQKARQRRPSLIESDEDEDIPNQRNYEDSSDDDQPILKAKQRRPSRVESDDEDETSNIQNLFQKEERNAGIIDAAHDAQNALFEDPRAPIVKQEVPDEEIEKQRTEKEKEQPKKLDDETILSLLDFSNVTVISDELIDGALYYKLRFNENNNVELLVEEKVALEKAPVPLLEYLLG